MSEETNFPTKFHYTKDDIEEAAQREKLGEGYYPFLIGDVEKKISKKKEQPGKDGNMGENLMLVPVIKPMEDEEDPDSTFGFPLRDYWTLPFVNELVKGHVAPGSWAPEMLSHRLAACFPDEVYGSPKANKSEGLTYRGVKIEKSAQHDCRKEAYTSTYKKAEQLGADPSSLINCYFWAEVFYQEDSDWPSLRNHCAELPRNAKVGPGMIKDTSAAKGSKGKAAKKKKSSKRRK